MSCWYKESIFFSVQCINPSVSRGIIHADKPHTSAGMYAYNTTIRWTCVTGAKLEGHDTTRCLASGRWSHRPPKCWYGKELVSMFPSLHSDYIGHFTAFMSVMDHFLTLNRIFHGLGISWVSHHKFSVLSTTHANTFILQMNLMCTMLKCV